MGYIPYDSTNPDHFIKPPEVINCTTCHPVQYASVNIRDALVPGSDNIAGESEEEPAGDTGTELPKDDPVIVNPVSVSPSATYLSVEENKIYVVASGSNLIITSLPDSHLESVIYFSTGSSAIDIQTSYKLIGDLTTKPNKACVISIANRYVIMGKAVGVEV